MKVHPTIPLYGDPAFRGKCPSEQLEQVTFFNRIRKQYPDTWGVLATHPRNEGDRTYGQVAREKAEGLTTGASDIIIPGRRSFVCELKRRDRTQCALKDEQEKYLLAAIEAGAFACIALGVDAAWMAFEEWKNV